MIHCTLRSTWVLLGQGDQGYHWCAFNHQTKRELCIISWSILTKISKILLWELPSILISRSSLFLRTASSNTPVVDTIFGSFNSTLLLHDSMFPILSSCGTSASSRSPYLCVHEPFLCQTQYWLSLELGIHHYCKMTDYQEILSTIFGGALEKCVLIAGSCLLLLFPLISKKHLYSHYEMDRFSPHISYWLFWVCRNFQAWGFLKQGSGNQNVFLQPCLS